MPVIFGCVRLMLVCFAIGVAVPVYAQFAESTSAPIVTIDNPVIHEYQFWQQSAYSTDRQPPSITDPEQAPKVITHKSSLLAAGLSLLIPGLGEYYVGDDIWRGMIFTAIEGGLWYGRITYLNRGDDSVGVFQAWADSLWSPERYSDSLNHLLEVAHRNFQIDDPNDFSQINTAEDTLDYFNFPNFTHRLPSKGSQQYYELISKYDQFAWGWRDATSQVAKNSRDAEHHAQLRANMNEQYEIADYFLWGMVVNRILSAIDAALLAKDHNSAIRLQGDLLRRPFPNGQMGYVPTAKLRWMF